MDGEREGGKQGERERQRAFKGAKEKGNGVIHGQTNKNRLKSERRGSNTT